MPCDYAKTILMESMAMGPSPTETLDLRLTPEAKQMIAAAAEASGSPVNDYVVESALARAEETLADRRFFVLNPEQWAELRAALDAPPRVLPGLKRLLEQQASWE